MWDDIPLHQKDLDEVDKLAAEFEPILQKKDLRLSIQDIVNLREHHEGLTPKEVRFVYNYVIYKNAPTAAFKAGFNDTSEQNMGRYTAVQATRLLQKPEVKNLINALQLRAAAALVIDENYVVNMCAMIAENFDNKASDRIDALKLITKIKGFEAPARMIRETFNHLADNSNSLTALDALNKIYQAAKESIAVPESEKIKKRKVITTKATAA